MKKFTLYNNSVDIIDNHGKYHRIFFTHESGQVYFRNKIGSIFGVKHSGIFIGRDTFRKEYFLHNHYQTGPAFVSGEEFRKGMPLFLYNHTSENMPVRTIEKALFQTMGKEPYHAIYHNCQTFTNEASNNRRESEAVKMVIGKLILAILLFVGIRKLIINSNK